MSCLKCSAAFQTKQGARERARKDFVSSKLEAKKPKIKGRKKMISILSVALLFFTLVFVYYFSLHDAQPTNYTSYSFITDRPTLFDEDIAEHVKLIEDYAGGEYEIVNVGFGSIGIGFTSNNDKINYYIEMDVWIGSDKSTEGTLYLRSWLNGISLTGSQQYEKHSKFWTQTKDSNSITWKCDTGTLYVTIDKKILSVATSDASLTVEVKPRGIPFWYGRRKGEWTYLGEKFLQSGYDESVTVNGTLTYQGKTYVFFGYGGYGFLLNVGKNWTEWKYLTQMSIYTPKVWGTLIEAYNPATNKYYSHFGRINIQGNSYRFDDYTLQDIDINNGELKITGRFDDGSVEINTKLDMDMFGNPSFSIQGSVNFYNGTILQFDGYGGGIIARK